MKKFWPLILVMLIWSIVNAVIESLCGLGLLLKIGLMGQGAHTALYGLWLQMVDP